VHLQWPPLIFCAIHYNNTGPRLRPDLDFVAAVPHRVAYAEVPNLVLQTRAKEFGSAKLKPRIQPAGVRAAESYQEERVSSSENSGLQSYGSLSCEAV
jgi:hypothetical protein